MSETPQGSCTATRARELLYAIRIFDAGDQHSLKQTEDELLWPSLNLFLEPKGEQSKHLARRLGALQDRMKT